jgi:hypothetical protein
MTSKPTNKFSPKVRTQAVRMVLDHEGDRRPIRRNELIHHCDHGVQFGSMLSLKPSTACSRPRLSIAGDVGVTQRLWNSLPSNG